MRKAFKPNLITYFMVVAAFSMCAAFAQSVKTNIVVRSDPVPNVKQIPLPSQLPTPVTPTRISTPTPVVVPTPTPPPSRPELPILPPRAVFTPDIVVPADATNLSIVHGPMSMSPVNDRGAAMRGIKPIDSAKFPELADLDDDDDDDGEGMVVWSDEATRYQRISPCSVKVDKGQVLVSVRKPSHLALVRTPLGDVAIRSGSDLLISVGSPEIRVMNLDGRGKGVRLKLNKGPFSGDAVRSVALAPGFEVVAGAAKLTRRELRPSDGFARRHYSVLDKGFLAVQEFSVESVLNSSGLIAQMAQELSGKKVDRIIGDMSKMAAVLNYMNGTQGYVAANEGARLAGK